MNHAEAENMLQRWAKESDRLHTLGRSLSKAAHESLSNSCLKIIHTFEAPIYLYIRVSILGFELIDHGNHSDDVVWRATTFAGAVELAAPKISERLEAYAKRVAQLEAVLDAVRRV